MVEEMTSVRGLTMSIVVLPCVFAFLNAELFMWSAWIGAVIVLITVSRGDERIIEWKKKRGEVWTMGTIALLYAVRGGSGSTITSILWHGMMVTFAVVLFGRRRILASTVAFALAASANLARVTGVVDPFSFLFDFVRKEERMWTVARWTVILTVSLPAIAKCRSAGVDRIVSRKLFHFVAIALFASPSNNDPELMGVAYAIALGLAIWLEAYRMNEREEGRLSRFYHLFLAEDERNTVALTHIYLLFGCASTLWLSDYDHSTLRISGLAVLGAGDAAAALVGRSLGKVRWLGDSKRTLEGSLAFSIATTLALCFLSSSHSCSGQALPTFSSSQCRCFYPFAAIQLALLEATTSQSDNLFLPLFAFAALRARKTMS